MASAQKRLNTLNEWRDAVARCGGVAPAARELGMAESTLRSALLRNRIKEAEAPKAPKDTKLVFPEFPDDDISVEDLINLQCKRFEKRHKFAESKKWFPVGITDDKPIGLTFFGDPHVDDNGCNWSLLKQHCDIHRNTPGLFGVNIGDTTNNWTGRLARLFANQDTSQATARKLAEWFLTDSGIKWAVWLQGNHDMWGDGSDILRRMNTKQIPMEDWSAKFKLVFPNGKECRIWAAHNFAGNSQWNSLHGIQKAAHLKDQAHIYAAGHTHNWATHQEESASKEFIYSLIRARGYKFLDEYADILGHAPQQHGASVTVIIDPNAGDGGFVSPAFVDMELAADFLTYKRRKVK